MSEVTWEHLQNPVSKGYTIVAKFATCLVPMDLAPEMGYVVVCVTLFE
jgi:hypothetical protein